MKKVYSLFLLGGCMFFAVPAFATAKWASVVSQSASIYFDMKSLEHRDNTATFKYIYKMEDPDSTTETNYAITQFDFNCSERKFKVISSSYYNKKDKETDMHFEAVDDYQTPVKNSHGEDLLNLYCDFLKPANKLVDLNNDFSLHRPLLWRKEDNDNFYIDTERELLWLKIKDQDNPLLEKIFISIQIKCREKQFKVNGYINLKDAKHGILIDKEEDMHSLQDIEPGSKGQQWVKTYCDTMK